MKTLQIARGIAAVLSLAGVTGLVGCGAETGAPEEGANVGSTEQALGLSLANRGTQLDSTAFARSTTSAVMTFGGKDNSGNRLSAAYEFSYSGTGTGTWTAKTNADLSATRYGSKAIKIPGTSVFAVVGGIETASVNTIDILDPATANSRITLNMSVTRAQDFSLVPCGTVSGNKSRVLIIGGKDGANATNVLEVLEYDTATPANSTVYTLKNTRSTGLNFPDVVTLNTARYDMTAIPLSTTKIIVPGGDDGSSPIKSTEVLNLTSDCKLNSTSATHPTLGGDLPVKLRLFAAAPISLTINTDTYAAIVATGEDDGGNLPVSSYLWKDSNSTWTTASSTYNVVEGRVRAMFAPDGASAGDFALVGGKDLTGSDEATSRAADKWVGSGWSGSSTTALTTSRYAGFVAYIGSAYVAGLGRSFPSGGSLSVLQSVE